MGYKVRAIAVDIDGTLTDTTRKVSCRAIEGLRKQVDRGIIVMLVTGNVLPIAYALKQYLGMNGPVIAENGGIAYRDECVHYLSSIDEPQRAFEHLTKNMKVERIFSDKWRVTEIAIKPAYDLELIRKYVRGFEVKVLPSGWAHHIMHKDTDKANALRWICDNRLKIDLKEVAAIGDSDNDLRMIEIAGFGATLLNGSQKCKERANFVASKSYGDGIVEILRMLELEP